MLNIYRAALYWGAVNRKMEFNAVSVWPTQCFRNRKLWLSSMFGILLFSYFHLAMSNCWAPFIGLIAVMERLNENMKLQLLNPHFNETNNTLENSDLWEVISEEESNKINVNPGQNTLFTKKKSPLLWVIWLIISYAKQPMGLSQKCRLCMEPFNILQTLYSAKRMDLPSWTKQCFIHKGWLLWGVCRQCEPRTWAECSNERPFETRRFIVQLIRKTSSTFSACVG